ncbi:MAG: hypothetical protein A2172_03425 [Candidatus Woykebacteria bacterium RBG_13_40_15]|uniref:HTH cro/C1-type domain-containing protein n=1 Tax=Candidatus Woykebacteria bacterium RBG_13_40_15 TaxID=1802593 RepID=A0A1G1W6F5_9BACT|nr:MAG: hypothetical protein A2172_03425 [Candidatus Woykebacteria bacterium RBG_13_40_15]
MKKRPNFTTYEQFKKKLLAKPGVRKEYDDLQPEFEIVKAIVEARIKKKISQEELAKRMKTGQAVISRLETATASPSLSQIRKLADALDLKVHLHFSSR